MTDIMQYIREKRKRDHLKYWGIHETQGELISNFSSTTILELEVRLLRVKPAVWRRFRVPSTITLDVLHQAVQAVMGWTDSHVHKFESVDGFKSYVDSEQYNISGQEAGGCEEAECEENVTVSEVFNHSGSSLCYTYDMGDRWQHVIKLLKVDNDATAEEARFQCVAGNGACPPEDCGGICGYEHLKDCLTAKVRSKNAKERIKWFEDCSGTDATSFDPTFFDCQEADLLLKKLFASEESSDDESIS